MNTFDNESVTNTHEVETLCDDTCKRKYRTMTLLKCLLYFSFIYKWRKEDP